MAELTPQQIEHYRVEGFVVVPSVFSSGDLQVVDHTIEQLTEQALASGSLEGVMELEPETVGGRRLPRRIYNPFEQHENFRQLATDDRVIDRIVSLIGPDVALQHSKLNMKPAKIGSVVEWHQDLAYFPHTNDDLVTTLIYLDDATEQNGCLQVLPRHHTHFFNHELPDGTFAGMITEEIDDGRYGRPVALTSSAGSVIFMHPMTPHSSLSNRSDSGRRTLIFEYRAADAFPIYAGNNLDATEKYTHHLRGDQARFARFGGPPPVIYKSRKNVKSLYQLQAESKKIQGKS